MSREKMDAYGVLWPAARTYLDRKYEREVIGLDAIPDTPAIYAPNHIRFDDSPLVAVSYTEATGIAMRFGAKSEYFEGKGIDDAGKYGRSVRWVMEHSRMIPVEREGANIRALRDLQLQVAARLANGDAVALHPEGTRSDDGRLYKFKSGAARIALALEVPIVPVGVVYTDYSNTQKTRVTIEFGQPVLPEDYAKAPYTLLPGRQKAEHLTQVVENRVADMTKMDQTGTFAQLRKLRHLRDTNRGE